MFVTAEVDMLHLVLAWALVVFGLAHPVVYVTCNRIMNRVAVYVAVVRFALALRLTFSVLT